MDKQGQGALEYLLLIGGAVLVAVIVITLLLQITSQGQADTTATADAVAIRNCQQRNSSICGGTVASYITGAADCDEDSTYNACD
ncbi:MAG TPA: class III signal peptide-containing protein [archaeon]|nr:class III signal peptide-containing protein [archaeon]